MPMKQTVMPWLKETAHAVLSEDRVYRYALYRSLDGESWNDPAPDRRTVCFVMLNPSTADENANDPTIEKLMKYGRTWGYARLAVVNLFAYRETDSKKLRSLASTRDLIGPGNDQHILTVVGDSHQIVYGWGNEGEILGRGLQVARLIDEIFGCEFYCFKKTQSGQPVHPLYQRDDAALIPFE
jgi:hypothetical protein